MKDYAQDFGPFENTIWLNCAHQESLPKVAVEQAEEAIAWKVAPDKLTTERFNQVPEDLRRALGRLIVASHDDVILGNSASYGLHLLANGIRWKAEDEILLMKGDFPADILPWLSLKNQGVKIRFLKPRQYVVQPDELLRNITPSTRLLCITVVHSFSGFVADTLKLGEICRAKRILFILNVSQALGARRFNIAETPVDALVGVGFKWLCGPYGTSFCWINPSLRESLQCNQAYWPTMQTSDDLAKEQGVPELREALGARAYDVFGTANFFNFKPLAASVEYLLAQGIEEIERHDQSLVARLVEGVDSKKLICLVPGTKPCAQRLFLSRIKGPPATMRCTKNCRRQKCSSHTGRESCDSLRTCTTRKLILIRPYRYSTPLNYFLQSSAFYAKPLFAYGCAPSQRSSLTRWWMRIGLAKVCRGSIRIVGEADSSSYRR